MAALLTGMQISRMSTIETRIFECELGSKQRKARTQADSSCFRLFWRGHRPPLSDAWFAWLPLPRICEMLPGQS